MKNATAAQKELPRQSRAPLMTKIGLALVFALGICIIVLGLAGQRAYDTSGFSAESAYGAIYTLSGDVRAAWDKQLKPQLDALPADRSFVDEDMANTLIYLFHDYLLGRRCATCGHVFTDTAQANHCPRCGAGNPDWYLQGSPLSAPPEK